MAKKNKKRNKKRNKLAPAATSLLKGLGIIEDGAEDVPPGRPAQRPSGPTAAGTAGQEVKRIGPSPTMPAPISKPTAKPSSSWGSYSVRERTRTPDARDVQPFIMEPKVAQTFNAYAIAAWPNEIGGMLRVVRDDDGRWRAIDIKIFKQHVTGAYFELDGAAEAMFRMEMYREGRKAEIPEWRSLIHSHPDMQPFMSGVDHENLTRLASKNFAFSIICAAKADPSRNWYTAHYAQVDPMPLLVSPFCVTAPDGKESPLSGVDLLSDEELMAIRDETAELLTNAKPRWDGTREGITSVGYRGSQTFSSIGQQLSTTTFGDEPVIDLGDDDAAAEEPASELFPTAIFSDQEYELVDAALIFCGDEQCFDFEALHELIGRISAGDDCDYAQMSLLSDVLDRARENVLANPAFNSEKADEIYTGIQDDVSVWLIDAELDAKAKAKAADEAREAASEQRVVQVAPTPRVTKTHQPPATPKFETSKLSQQGRYVLRHALLEAAQNTGFSSREAHLRITAGFVEAAKPLTLIEARLAEEALTAAGPTIIERGMTDNANQHVAAVTQALTEFIEMRFASEAPGLKISPSGAATESKPAMPEGTVDIKGLNPAERATCQVMLALARKEADDAAKARLGAISTALSSGAKLTVEQIDELVAVLNERGADNENAQKAADYLDKRASEEATDDDLTLLDEDGNEIAPESVLVLGELSDVEITTCQQAISAHVEQAGPIDDDTMMHSIARALDEQSWLTDVESWALAMALREQMPDNARARNVRARITARFGEAQQAREEVFRVAEMTARETTACRKAFDARQRVRSESPDSLLDDNMDAIARALDSSAVAGLDRTETAALLDLLKHYGGDDTYAASAREHLTALLENTPGELTRHEFVSTPSGQVTKL